MEILLCLMILTKVILTHSEPSITSCWKGLWSILDLQYIDSGLGINPTLKWKYKYTKTNEGTCNSGLPYDLSDYLIPNNIIFVKQ